MDHIPTRVQTKTHKIHLKKKKSICLSVFELQARKDGGETNSEVSHREIQVQLKLTAN